MEKSLILDHKNITQKIVRMAYQIAEASYGEPKIVVIGIDAGGYRIAGELCKELEKINEQKIALGKLKINKAQPHNDNVSMDIALSELKDAAVILVDDVLESGRTLMFAAKYLLDAYPKRLGTAVLVDRMHPKFPIRADFVGLTLSTTLQNHISFVEDANQYNVFLS